ncbi:hypothetical protein Hypma_011916 [Hypsizygus marmoreus]|uniref:Uncharacterized protein n=1 Tax=Hypsizygus marmoreus TaxID=39966 RepID=A0A369JNU0_HYPMA|nr:hypothetical protein Hypma_011916 [Hypsizygus marmoreus]
MPAAYDIYADQLRDLRRGQPLYYPEPSAEDGPVQIGDVGYTRQGAFCRLFNVSKAGDDPSQAFGVPEGFEPLVIGRILEYEGALEPGPLHSKTIFRVNADVGTTGAVLPADASFRFSCASSRGAILMLETQMSRHQALHDKRFKDYLLQHCLSWYTFAGELGVQVEFGEIMLVTECSKTAAWASAVYSQSSREFGMSFSAGGMFLPSVGGAAISIGLEKIGPVEYRRSRRRAIMLEDVQNVTKDQTVFIKGYRLGSRSLYLKSIARKIMKTTNRSRLGDLDSDNVHGPSSTQGSDNRLSPSSSPPSPASPSHSQDSHANDSSSELLRSLRASAMSPDWPDFHPAVALLAHQMETTNVEIATVHDDEWCCSYSEQTRQIIDDYAQCFFCEKFLESTGESNDPNTSAFSLVITDQKSMTRSEEVAKTELLKTQGIGKIPSLDNSTIRRVWDEPTRLLEPPPVSPLLPAAIFAQTSAPQPQPSSPKKSTPKRYRYQS